MSVTRLKFGEDLVPVSDVKFGTSSVKMLAFGTGTTSAPSLLYSVYTAAPYKTTKYTSKTFDEVHYQDGSPAIPYDLKQNLGSSTEVELVLPTDIKALLATGATISCTLVVETIKASTKQNNIAHIGGAYRTSNTICNISFRQDSGQSKTASIESGMPPAEWYAAGSHTYTNGEEKTPEESAGETKKLTITLNSQKNLYYNVQRQATRIELSGATSQSWHNLTTGAIRFEFRIVTPEDLASPQ